MEFMCNLSLIYHKVNFHYMITHCLHDSYNLTTWFVAGCVFLLTPLSWMALVRTGPLLGISNCGCLISIFAKDLLYFHIFSHENWCICGKIHQKPWVLAPTLSKTVGAITPTAPTLTRALLFSGGCGISNGTRWNSIRFYIPMNILKSFFDTLQGRR